MYKYTKKDIKKKNPLASSWATTPVKGPVKKREKQNIAKNAKHIKTKQNATLATNDQNEFNWPGVSGSFIFSWKKLKHAQDLPEPVPVKYYEILRLV